MGARKDLTMAAALVMAATLAMAGCLVDEEGNGDDGVDVPEDRSDARLLVTGEVDTEINRTMTELLEGGLTEFAATFVNSVGTTYTHNYSGISLSALLDEAGASADADLVEVEASDGYRALLFADDVDETSYLSVKEESEWQDLADAGAFRLVDTDLPSSYWVRQVVAIHVVSSDPLTFTGTVNVTDAITAGWVREHADTEVTWQEGIKNRTYTGVRLEDVLDAVGADRLGGWAMSFTTDDGTMSHYTLDVEEDGFLVVDSRGRYVFVNTRMDLVYTGLESVDVGPIVLVWGEVGEEKWMDADYLRGLPPMTVEYKGTSYTGAALVAVVAETGPDAGVDRLTVKGDDGYFAVLPYTDIDNTIVAYEADGAPLGEDDGFLRIVDGERPGNFHVGMLAEIWVTTSPPLEVTGLVNLTDVITVGSLAGGADTNVTYDDGMRERTYQAMTWDAFLAAHDYDSSAATYVNLTDGDGAKASWEIADLLGKTDAGLALDSRGYYVAVLEELGEYVHWVVSIHVG